MELLKHMKSDRLKFTKIRNIYDIWMRKNGSMKEWPIEVCFGNTNLQYCRITEYFFSVC